MEQQKIKSLNEQLVKNNAHLISINEELDQFAYIASHDLQEPLRKIMVFSDKILMKGNMDEETEKYFKKIIGSSKRMQLLINDLLTFSRQSAISSDFKKADLTVLAKEAIAGLEIEIEQNNAVIQMEELPVVWAVPSLMTQLFHNLLSNAIKFRKKTVEPVIHIEAEKISGRHRAPNPLLTNRGGYYKIRIFRISYNNRNSIRSSLLFAPRMINKNFLNIFFNNIDPSRISWKF